jgi:hypothetical protein
MVLDWAPPLALRKGFAFWADYRPSFLLPTSFQYTLGHYAVLLEQLPANYSPFS